MKTNYEQKDYSTSKYLTSILDPMQGPGEGIPDMNMTPSHEKSVNINHNFVLPVGTTGEGLILYLPHELFRPVRLFLWNTVAAKYVFNRSYGFDQDLATDYTYGRFISGLLHTKSSTIAAGAFALAGEFTATAFQEPPPLRSLTYNQITTYKQTNTDVVAGVGVAEGIIALALPDGNQDFKIFPTENSFNTSSKLESYDRFGSPSSGWLAGCTGLNTPIYDLEVGNAPYSIPENLWDPFTITAIFTMVVFGPFSQLEATLQARFDTVSDDGQIITTRTEEQITYNSTGNVGLTNVTCHIKLWSGANSQNYGAALKQVRVMITNNAAVPAVTLQVGARIVIESDNYNLRGARGPGHMIGFQSVAEGQNISITGIANMEVVPGFQLSRNLGNSYFSPFHPKEMEMVMTYLAMDSVGIRMIWAAGDYKNFLRTGLYEHVNMQNIATATGWGDWIKSMWNNVRPAIGAALPILGGTYLGPGGAALGGIVGANLPRAGTYRQLTQGVGRSRGFDTPFTAGLPGRTALLGNDTFTQYVQKAIASAIVTDYRGNIPYKNPSQLTQASNKYTYLTNSDTSAINFFPIVFDGRVEIGNYTRSNAPMNDEEGKPHQYVTVDYAGNRVHISNDVDTTVDMLQTMIFCWVAVNNLSIRPLGEQYITLDTPIIFEEFSSSAACFAAMCGVRLDNPITGAWTVSNSGIVLPYIANDLRTKLNFFEELQVSLFVVCERSDLQPNSGAEFVWDSCNLGVYSLIDGTRFPYFAIKDIASAILAEFLVKEEASYTKMGEFYQFERRIPQAEIKKQKADRAQALDMPYNAPEYNYNTEIKIENMPQITEYGQLIEWVPEMITKTNQALLEKKQAILAEYLKKNVVSQIELFTPSLIKFVRALQMQSTEMLQKLNKAPKVGGGGGIQLGDKPKKTTIKPKARGPPTRANIDLNDL